MRLRLGNHATGIWPFAVNQPPSIGGLVFLVANLIGSEGGASVYSIEASSKGLSKLLVLGAVDPVADYQLLVYCSTLACFQRALPFYHSRMAMWIILLALGEVSSSILLW